MRRAVRWAAIGSAALMVMAGCSSSASEDAGHDSTTTIDEQAVLADADQLVTQYWQARAHENGDRVAELTSGSAQLDSLERTIAQGAATAGDVPPPTEADVTTHFTHAQASGDHLIALTGNVETTYLADNQPFTTDHYVVEEDSHGLLLHDLADAGEGGQMSGHTIGGGHSETDARASNLELIAGTLAPASGSTPARVQFALKFDPGERDSMTLLPHGCDPQGCSDAVTQQMFTFTNRDGDVVPCEAYRIGSSPGDDPMPVTVDFLTTDAAAGGTLHMTFDDLTNHQQSAQLSLVTVPFHGA